jgi:hypothetical protein
MVVVVLLPLVLSLVLLVHVLVLVGGRFLVLVAKGCN